MTQLSNHQPSGLVSRRSVLAAGAALPLVAGLGVGAARAAATFPDPSDNVPTSAIVGYDDMVKALKQIAKSSKHVTVHTLRELGISPGVTEAGRDLWVATVGTGPTHVWLQGRIHGNEPFGTDTLITLLKSVGANGSKAYAQIREQLTLHVIPMYNPDGAELNIRHTILQDGSGRRIDLNRDWAPTAFAAKESQSWYAYWARIKPSYGLDIHHQGLKRNLEGDPVSMSLGISLSPSGPTLPTVKGGLYDRQTRQMQGLVYESLKGYGFINMDRYTVGGPTQFQELDIKGGVSSAVMIGLNWNNLNAAGHSHPMVFFETSGNTSRGSIGQKARGKAIRQNVLGTSALLEGIASGSVWRVDPMIWHEQIPHLPYNGYQTDAGVVLGWPAHPPV